MVTPALFKIGPTPQKMATRSEAEILEASKRADWPKQSQACKAPSRITPRATRGEVPKPSGASAPGVGHKTAGVVLNHAFHIPAFPVDTHISPCSTMGLPLQTCGTNRGGSKKTLPDSDRELLHLQIITYGREHCPARGCYGLTGNMYHLLSESKKTSADKKAYLLHFLHIFSTFTPCKIYGSLSA